MAGTVQSARGTNRRAAVILPWPESISRFPGDNILIILWEATHALLLVHLVPSGEASLASVTQHHNQAQVREGN